MYSCPAGSIFSKPAEMRSLLACQAMTAVTSPKTISTLPRCANRKSSRRLTKAASIGGPAALEVVGGGDAEEVAVLGKIFRPTAEEPGVSDTRGDDVVLVEIQRERARLGTLLP